MSLAGSERTVSTVQQRENRVLKCSSYTMPMHVEGLAISCWQGKAAGPGAAVAFGNAPHMQ